MLHIKPNDIAVAKLHSYLLSSVGPRPIALASTLDDNGNPNLSPFSFFNIFSANPPIAIFSPARRVRNNTTKHTLENVLSNKEVVINIVTEDIVQQTSLSSTEYENGVNEFIKAGFTPINSETVAPFRVKESPVQLECKVNEVISLGDEGGAGNLVICEIKMVHINEDILDDDGTIDPNKLKLVGRMGGNWYCKTTNESIFEVVKPIKNLGIGIDKIPQRIKNSYILSGNDLGMLGNIEALPSVEEVEKYKNENYTINEILNFSNEDEEAREGLHHRAKELLSQGKIENAWKTLLIDKINRL
jgi:flavin reductase (DIM6/NTAB) family NADH-FMN oxidoreductase RutF